MPLRALRRKGFIYKPRVPSTKLKLGEWPAMLVFTGRFAARSAGLAPPTPQRGLWLMKAAGKKMAGIIFFDLR